MKQFIVTVAGIIVAVFIVSTFILGANASDEGSLRGQSNLLGDKMIEECKEITD